MYMRMNVKKNTFITGALTSSMSNTMHNDRWGDKDLVVLHGFPRPHLCPPVSRPSSSRSRSSSELPASATRVTLEERLNPILVLDLFVFDQGKHAKSWFVKMPGVPRVFENVLVDYMSMRV